MEWLWILGAVVAGVAGISALQYRASRGQYRPLAQRQPQARARQAPELGMEAVDMEAVRHTQRRNESFERSQTIWSRKGGISQAIDTTIAPMADDETYAKRFHTAFMKNKD